MSKETDALLDKLLEEVDRMYEFKGNEAYYGNYPIFSKKAVVSLILNHKKYY